MNTLRTKENTANTPGFTLIELLVALVIGLIVLTGVWQVFQSSNTTYRVQSEYARMQENARFAIHFLTQDVRMAGYFGCLSYVPSVTNTLNSSAYLYELGTALEGFESVSATAWHATPDATAIPSPKGGSDIITIRGAFDAGIQVIMAMPSTSADLTVKSMTTPAPLEDFDIAMISDCEAAAVFQVTNITTSAGNDNIVHNTGVGTPGNTTKDLGHIYEEGAEVMKIDTRSFYIRDNSAGVPSLYRKVGTDSAEELVQNVEFMQIVYGEDTNNDGDVDQYSDASAVSDWESVRSVRIGVLVRSDRELFERPENTNTYTVAGTTIDPPDDHRLRQVYETTIGLRNRLK